MERIKELRKSNVIEFGSYFDGTNKKEHIKQIWWLNSKMGVICFYLENSNSIWYWIGRIMSGFGLGDDCSSFLLHLNLG